MARIARLFYCFLAHLPVFNRSTCRSFSFAQSLPLFFSDFSLLPSVFLYRPPKLSQNLSQPIDFFPFSSIIKVRERPYNKAFPDFESVCSQPSTRKTKLKEKKHERTSKQSNFSNLWGSYRRSLCGTDPAEALTILPYFTPAAIPGITIGCFLANLLGGAPVLDIVFGSLATLIGALISYRLRRRKALVCLPPILANTLVIPWVLRFAYGVPDAIPYLMFTVGMSECIAVGLLGNLLLVALL